MLEIRVRGLAPDVMDAIRERAIENGNTMEGEVRQILNESVIAAQPAKAGRKRHGGFYQSWEASWGITRNVRTRH